mmetsp:Transcript_115986/g.368937  ORF Transcript_115986/g.368937 Transcript_115986/m.368937 type:complete len:408 (-) Transcript_115986:1016-2239(-)
MRLAAAAVGGGGGGALGGGGSAWRRQRRRVAVAPVPNELLRAASAGTRSTMQALVQLLSKLCRRGLRSILLHPLSECSKGGCLLPQFLLARLRGRGVAGSRVHTQTEGQRIRTNTFEALHARLPRGRRGGLRHVRRAIARGDGQTAEARRRSRGRGRQCGRGHPSGRRRQSGRSRIPFCGVCASGSEHGRTGDIHAADGAGRRGRCGRGGTPRTYARRWRVGLPTSSLRTCRPRRLRRRVPADPRLLYCISKPDALTRLSDEQPAYQISRRWRNSVRDFQIHVGDPVHGLHLARSREWRLPCEHLEQEHTHGPDINCDVVRLVEHHLRRQVVPGAAEGVPRRSIFRQLRAPAKVRKLRDAACVHQDVLRLEVSMDDSPFVQVIQRVGNANEDFRGFRLGQSTLLPHY